MSGIIPDAIVRGLPSSPIAIAFSLVKKAPHLPSIL